MSERFATDGMAYDVLSTVRREIPALTGSSNLPGYDALHRLAPILSCLKYGHPDQPTRRLRRFRQQPWRCDRCETWWVTRHETTYATIDTGGQWIWERVDHEIVE